jgi:hypothetical protein
MGSARVLKTGFFLSVAAVTFSASPTRSDLLWSDGCDVRQRIQGFVRSKIAKTCTWPKADSDVQSVCRRIKDDGLFGYQDVRRQSDDRPTIAVEVVVRLEKPCFAKLKASILKSIKAKVPIISNRKASLSPDSKFDADGGPTLIFYFRAKPSELTDVDRISYD